VRTFVALAALLASLAASALPAQTWVVAIGNNRGAADEVALLYAERDAQELADVLRQQGGVSSRRTLLLLDEEAEQVRRALQDLNAEIRHRTKDGPTALFVFYSGHADAAALHLRGTSLAMDELKALVEGSPAAMRVLVIDACRSGTVTRVKGVQPAPPFEIRVDDQVATEGMAIITSSAAGETSQESDLLRASFFTHHLVNALRGAADHDGDGRITLAEAYGYTYQQTLRSSGQTLALQHPTYAFDVKGRGELVLTRPGEGDGRQGRLRLGPAAVYLVSEKREGGPLVAELSPPRDGVVLALPAGQYFVQQRSAAEYREYQVTLAAGGEVDLAKLEFRRMRYDQLVRRRGTRESHTRGFTLLAGGRGAILDGEGASPQLHLGFGLDFAWGTLGLRLRGSTVRSDGRDGLLPRRHDELGTALTLQRFVDLDVLSVAFGVSFEGTWHAQRFEGDRLARDRSTVGFGFGGLFSAERHLGAGLALRLEGGPVTMLLPVATTARERETGHAWASPLTWWGAGGLVWRR
jgi:hypothetical protein